MFLNDPFDRASRVIHEKLLHKLIRFGAVLTFFSMLLKRVQEYHFYYVKPLWFVETLIYFALVTAFLVRTDPVDRSQGIREVIIPLVGSILPFALLYSPPAPWITENRTYLLTTFWWMTASTAFTVWGMWTLRRSFSITVEARALVTAGPYRFIRHPIYLGEILSSCAVAFWRFSFWNLLILIVFVVIQIARSRWEEGKLEKNFPEYGIYASKAWWVLQSRGSDHPQ
jgi:protein-S-isoprenylcysteine O-methyltransferase Ste14